VIDTASAKGYQLKGTAELISSGPLFDLFADHLNQAMLSLPPLKYVVKIAVESVYDQSGGPDAGKQIA
jgi:predicted pyridoxine 5'-phosphate oxidase superfamily flavin-nucleotide-binding protein